MHLSMATPLGERKPVGGRDRDNPRADQGDCKISKTKLRNVPRAGTGNLVK